MRENLGNVFTDGGVVEIDRVARMPLAESIFEVDLHEVAGDRSNKHVTRLAVNCVIKLEDFVVPRPPLSHSHSVLLAPGQYCGH